MLWFLANVSLCYASIGLVFYCVIYNVTSLLACWWEPRRCRFSHFIDNMCVVFSVRTCMCVHVCALLCVTTMSGIYWVMGNARLNGAVGRYTRLVVAVNSVPSLQGGLHSVTGMLVYLSQTRIAFTEVVCSFLILFYAVYTCRKQSITWIF